MTNGGAAGRGCMAEGGEESVQQEAGGGQGGRERWREGVRKVASHPAN